MRKNKLYLTYYFDANKQIIEYVGTDATSGEIWTEINPKLYNKFTCNINDSTIQGPFIVSDLKDELWWDVEIEAELTNI